MITVQKLRQHQQREGVAGPAWEMLPPAQVTRQPHHTLFTFLDAQPTSKFSSI